MSLAGLAPGVIRPTALLLNVLVALLASVQFWRAGHFSWPLLWPFALLAVPMAFAGGALALPTRAFQLIVGALLLLSALRLLARMPEVAAERPPSRGLACAVGAGVGLLAGLTGTVVAGGFAGSWLGSRRLPSRALGQLLALVLALG
jgi:hypothetical protein